MMMKFKMHETLENAFIAGLLLTGSVERAEAAILESVRMAKFFAFLFPINFEAFIRCKVLQSLDVVAICCQCIAV